MLRAAGPRAADRDRPRHGEGENLQVAQGSEGTEGRRIGAGVEHPHDRQLFHLQGWPEALGHLRGRRRPGRDRDRGFEKRADRRRVEHRPGDEQARAGRRRENHRRYAHAQRDRASPGRTDAGWLPLCPGRFHQEESEYSSGADQRHRARRQVDPRGFRAGRAAHRARVVSPRGQGAVPVFVQQGERSDLHRRNDLRRGREDRAQGDSVFQSRGESERDQARPHLHERVRQESEREVQVTSALALENIDCTFVSREDPSQRYTALRRATLHVRDGEFVSVVGPTGCGKSTLLNIAAGLLQPSAGQVTVFGDQLTGINSRAGYLFQAEALMPWRNTIENVVAGLEFRGVGHDEALARGRDWLKRVGLAGFEKRFPHQLSGGMRKRAALAQMLILDPQILLMDEPFSALDIQTRQLMENELLELWGANRKSVVFITHDLEEAISLSDRVVVLSAGPESHPIGDYAIDLPRPRDVAEIRLEPRFIEIHTKIWHAMKEEVLKGYAQQQKQ